MTPSRAHPPFVNDVITVRSFRRSAVERRRLPQYGFFDLQYERFPRRSYSRRPSSSSIRESVAKNQPFSPRGVFDFGTATKFIPNVLLISAVGTHPPWCRGSASLMYASRMSQQILMCSWIAVLWSIASPSILLSRTPAAEVGNS